MPRFSAPDGTDLFYADDGAGPPLLCLAGLTRNSTDFEYVLPNLAGRRVIRLDYRGRGKSAWADPATYTIPVETQDTLALLDHLGLERVPVLGSSRGGLIGMAMAGFAKDRLSGLCLNDVGPVLSPEGLAAISGYVGLRPKQKSYAEAAGMRSTLMTGFASVPHERWEAEVRKHYVEREDGLDINYDPRLRDAFTQAGDAPLPDLWPLFDALEGLPVAVVRGVNSDILSEETLAEMTRRRPDLITGVVPDRGHQPFLDEPEAVAAIRYWLAALGDG